MRINKCEDNVYVQPFGTYLGINMQEKVLLCKQRNMFTPERAENLRKIEDDGLGAVLDISDTYEIKKTQNNKALLTIKKCLTLNESGQKTVILKMNEIYEPVKNTSKLYFNTHKFMKLFDNEFNLAGKIQEIVVKSI